MSDDPDDDALRGLLDGDPPDGVDEQTVVAAAAAADTDQVHELAESLVGAAGDPDDADRIVDGLVTALASSEVPLPVAASLAAGFVEANPDRAQAVVPELVAHLESDFTINQRPAANALARIAAVAPDAVTPAVQHLPPLLAAEVPGVREPASRLAIQVASDAPERAKPLVPDILDLLSEHYDTFDAADELGHAVDDMRTARDNTMTTELEKEAQKDRIRNAVVRGQVVQVLAYVVRADPGVLEGRVDRLVDGLAAERNPTVTLLLVDLLGLVAADRPGVLGPAVEPLGDLLAEDRDDQLDEEELPASVMWALGLVAQEHGGRVADTVREVLPTVLEELDSPDPQRRGAAVSLLDTLSRHHPEALRSETGTLAALLEDDQPLIAEQATLILDRLAGQDPEEETEPPAAGGPELDVQSAAEEIFDSFRRADDGDGI